MITAVGTDIGRVREINEDAFSVRRIDHDSYCMIIADGMGGHKAGETASRRACSIIGDRICASLADCEWNSDSVFEVMQESISAANKTLYSAQLTDSELAGMGTTVVAVVVKGNRAFVCNVGDSRLYYISDDIVQITKDHSYVQDLLDKGLISETEAADHPNKNIITRAVGTDIDVSADVFELECASDSKIVMCTDGLSNFVTDKDILAIVTSNTPQVANKLLIEAANNNGGRDNITVINIDFGEV